MVHAVGLLPLLWKQTHFDLSRSSSSLSGGNDDILFVVYLQTVGFKTGLPTKRSNFHCSHNSPTLNVRRARNTRQPIFPFFPRRKRLQHITFVARKAIPIVDSQENKTRTAKNSSPILFCSIPNKLRRHTNTQSPSEQNPDSHRSESRREPSRPNSFLSELINHNNKDKKEKQRNTQ